MQLVSRQKSLKTWYDSFDGRLYTNGIICEFDQSRGASSLTLLNFEQRQIIASQEFDAIPSFGNQFSPGKIRSCLETILKMRALLPVYSLGYYSYYINILNKDEKTTLRLFIEEYEMLNNRLIVQPVRGYDKAAEQFIEIITTELNLSPADKPVLLMALKLQGRKPDDYSSKLNINLDPAMRADIASKYIYSHLLKTIKDNEQGAIANIDSEFLHDFRVAVRRTRSGLSQIKEVLPGKITARFSEFFSWLGQITGSTRDLDVYLLHFDDYKSSLPVSIRDDLNPLHEFLFAKQQKAQQELAGKLRSARYLSTLSEWEHFLKEQAPPNPVEANAKLTIQQLADRRIWKSYKRVVQEGSAITEHSPSEALHELRKSCKKLRYLMEFFQNLYPQNQLKKLIKSLKELQEVLGEFQDCQVQESNLKLFSEEMLTSNIPAKTFLAMGVLIQNIHLRKCCARRNFASRFKLFKQPENQSAFKALFAPKD
ncbi:CHAD domain-containing protein [Candidatus Methylobacter favarea]|nr:CHAD domain-containing protein [Candidatus Methylobacter favarea]